MKNDLSIEDYRKFADDMKRELSAEDELDLAERIAEGDDEALYELTDANLGLALRYAERYKNTDKYKDYEIMQLVRIANEGLFRAARAYSSGEGKKFRFNDYATWWVKHSLDKLAV